MKDLKLPIASSLKYETRKMEEHMLKLQEDFLHNFAWNGEDAYRTKYKVQQLQSILSDMKAEVDADYEVADRYIKYYKAYTRRAYNVRENSTGALHREVSTWKFVVNIEMLEYLEAITKEYNNN